jgi:predicted metal-dependent hydrolase
MTEARAFNFGNERIEYRVRRTLRRKTVALSYGFDGLEVLAPQDLSEEALDRHVRGKARWILTKRAALNEIGGEQPAREFCSGESYLYLGRQYRLKVVEDCRAHQVGTKLRGHFLVTPVRPETRSEHRSEEVRRRLQSWYEAHALTKLRERSLVYAERLGERAPAIFLRSQQKRWGSCDKDGVLRFNWRIVMAPLPLLDYVVAHEICHRVEHNHSHRFWRLLETIYPDLELARARLRVEGRRYYF